MAQKLTDAELAELSECIKAANNDDETVSAAAFAPGGGGQKAKDFFKRLKELLDAFKGRL